MKKHLIAAAVAAAVTAPAMAQNVSFYGTIDASVQAINNATANANTTAYFDGAIASSVWGMRGSEDLGGGLKAVFEVQGDLQTNNGGTHHHGLFRRAANVGVASNNFGQLDLGLKLNPLIAANAALMPVSGNSVATMSATVLGYADFFTKNAVTYTSPNFNGFAFQGQHGFANTQGESGAGAVTAWRLSYNQGILSANIAGQTRKASIAGQTSAANDGRAAALNVANAATVAATAAPAKDTLIYGLRLKPVDQLEIAIARISNEVNNNDAGVNNTTLSTASAAGLTLGQGETKVTATQVGIGYQMTPSILLGASVTAAESSRLTNTQARYALSKRTTAYAQYAIADNDSNGTVRFFPVAANTGTSPASVLPAAAVGVADRKQSSFGVGLIHSF